MTHSKVTRPLKFLALATLLASPMAIHAEAGDWYVAGSTMYFDDDGDRKIDDTIGGIQFQVGREMSEHFSLEGLLGYHDIDGFPAQEHLEIGLNALYNFSPDSRFAPYLIGGLGYLDADVGLPDFGGFPPAGDSEGDLTATAGVGVKMRFGSSRWSLRSEWRARHAFGDEDLTDGIFSLGLEYSFGDRAEEAAPAMVAAPLSDADSDGDGVVDARDACAGTPPGVAVDSAGCPRDSDGDGVGDDRDRCPGTARDAEIDAYGCEVIRLKPIYFDTESAVLVEQSKEKLEDIVEILKRHPDVAIEVAGHADSRGPDDFNMALSVRRAQAVSEYLENAGIDAARLTTRGYGESRPADSNDKILGRFFNRRVEVQAQDR